MSEHSSEGVSWSGLRNRLVKLMRNGSVSYGEGYLGSLADPLNPAELEALEGWLGVRLPEDYRRFLIEVSAGGVGPGEGLLRVRRMGNGWAWDTEPEHVVPSLVRRPFSTLRADGDTRMWMSGPPPFEENFPDLDAFQAAFDAWAERASAGNWSPERQSGAIKIQRYNIVQEDWLIVTGPARGTIWHLWPDHGRDYDMAPGTDRDGNPLTFTRWYLDWLTALEARVV